MKFEKFGDVLVAIDGEELIQDTCLDYLLHIKDFTLAENEKYLRKVEAKYGHDKKIIFDAKLAAGKEFEKKLLDDKTFLRDNTKHNARNIDLVCKNTNIHVEAKSEIIPLFGRKNLTSDFRKKTIMFEIIHKSRPGSMLRALLADTKALIFKQIYEYAYPELEKRLRSYNQAMKKEIPLQKFDYPPTSSKIIGFKILPLVRYLFKMYEKDIAKIQLIDDIICIYVPYSEIMKQNFVIKYEDFDELWMLEYSFE